VTNKTAAHRYARALFDVALAEKASLPQIEADLAGFADLMQQYPALDKVLLNPAVPVPRKRALVQDLVARAGAAPVAAKLLVLLAERDRLILLPELIAAYRQRLLDHEKVVRAEVTSSAPLDASRVRAIEATLAQITGRKVLMTARVDPALVGGLVARVGDTVYDASVATQLQRMKKQLERRM
jgi:F-type H+-transporting ATPase subunit delta